VVSSLVALFLIFYNWRHRHARRFPEPSLKDVEASIDKDPSVGSSWSLAPLRRFFSKDAEESSTSEPPPSPTDSIRTWFRWNEADVKLYTKSLGLDDGEGQAEEIPPAKAEEKASVKVAEKASKQVDPSNSFLDLASEMDKESIRARDSVAAVELKRSPTLSQSSPTLDTGPVAIRLKPSLRLRHDSGPTDVPVPVGLPLPARPRVTKARRRLSLLSLRQSAGSKPTIQKPALRVHFTPSYRETSVIPMPPPEIIPMNNEPLAQETPTSPPRRSRRIPPPLPMTRDIRPRSSLWYGGIASRSTASPAPTGTL